MTLEVCRGDRLTFTGTALLQDDGSPTALEDERLIVQMVHADTVLVSATVPHHPYVMRYVLHLDDVIAALTPDPLLPCSRCARHAALFRVEGEGDYVCGVDCHRRVSIFAMPIGKQGKRVQAYADDLLREQGYRLDGHEPQVWEGDYA
jgi:hypothetical protein